MKKPFYCKQTQAWYDWEQTGKGRKLIRLSKYKDEALRLRHERQTPPRTIGTAVAGMEKLKSHN